MVDGPLEPILVALVLGLPVVALALFKLLEPTDNEISLFLKLVCYEKTLQSTGERALALLREDPEARLITLGEVRQLLEPLARGREVAAEAWENLAREARDRAAEYRKQIHILEM